ncbi:PIN domain-containing protein [candidate division KSB1 bacterium]|nr:PIN domain-containing protein [candidate division KSB1 bacterium]MBL7094687.1 PIN domain-containing protein [candidate division KSB1 bacterium]
MKASKNYVLDTHILVWYFTGSQRLKRGIKNQIDKIRQQGGNLIVPTIVLSEALDISEKGRVQIDFGKMYTLIQEEPKFEIVGFGSEIFAETTRLKEIQEIHDRIIVATARFYNAGIFKKDRIIRNSGEVKIL